MQKCLENKQETNEKVLKENEELKKEMINIDSQLQQRKDEITKKVKENNNLKEEIKIMDKEQLQEKEKAASERERAIKTSLNTWRKLRENWKSKRQH